MGRVKRIFRTWAISRGKDSRDSVDSRWSVVKKKLIIGSLPTSEVGVRKAVKGLRLMPEVEQLPKIILTR